MNALKLDKQLAVIGGLVEGNSIRSVSRMTGVHKTTIASLLVWAGAKCQHLMDTSFRDLGCRTIEADEIWCFVAKKQGRISPQERYKNSEVGDQYIFVAIDADSKLVPCYTIGKRNQLTTEQFLFELRKRVAGRFQLTTDAYIPYKEAVRWVFGSNIDFAQLQKKYAADRAGEHRYSPPKITAVFHEVIVGNPDVERISTSYVERQNLTMRMQMRRLTRLTNAFSKKLSNLRAAVALHFAYYNFCRIHGTLRTTPAIAAGVTDHLWSMEDLLQFNC